MAKTITIKPIKTPWRTIVIKPKAPNTNPYNPRYPNKKLV